MFLLTDAGFSTPLFGSEVDVVTSDNVVLKCYLIRAAHSPSPRATVILFHGNGYHVWHHLHCSQQFHRLKCNVLMVSYRGYGSSKGVPTERGLRRDAQAALDFVLADSQLSSVPIVLHGHSLGGAVAVDLVSRNPTKVQALIIENTFLSIPTVARDIPFIRYFTFFVHQKWDSASKISSIPRTTPILMLSGDRDEVVPQKHMRELWALAHRRSSSGVKDDTPLEDVFQTFPEGQHADTSIQSGYWFAVGNFLRTLDKLRDSGMITS
ncbi:Alpha/Beta hydrolase protein [Desarmillaria tabescens]|uniref:Alpha/Beta hydrolase protein n=1 Tax=Armillaria tabescens TaxID=1929756 RepID=A0AA39N399_ARMTA|nr:Alpha/Beta hydrolase protein [Desarmillaria tabescens]KAK0455630.1 Alpha/Beta hydrolase protein [Desarmillaria tabescens]